MDFYHYSSESVQLVSELVNSDQRLVGERDGLMFLSDVERFLARHADLWLEDSLPPTESEVETVRHLRARLRSIFEADNVEDAARTINQLLAESGAMPRVSTHGGQPHLHFEASGSSFGRWLAAVSAMALATVLVDQEIGRLGVCAAADCHDVYLDTSRNRSRRHCTTKCSTRENVAAYRKRLQPEH